MTPTIKQIDLAIDELNEIKCSEEYESWENLDTMLEVLQHVKQHGLAIGEEKILKVIEGLAENQLRAVMRTVDKKGLENTDWGDIDTEGGALDFSVISKAIAERMKLR